MGGRIDAHVDVASFFSYVAFADLTANLDKLEAHGVKVNFIPTLIGGINSLSGNKPPWMLPAKAKYLSHDSKRAAERVNRPGLQSPKDLMSMAMTISPLRALHYIKANYSQATYHAAFENLFHRMWTPPNVNLTKDDNLAGVLADAVDAKGNKLFTQDDVKKIMDGREQFKDALKTEVQTAVDRGAFGAPWIWVTNDKGEQQAFFGSDRFNHIYNFLGVPFQDISILPPAKL